jgi:ankyrin repeat protein
LVSSEPRAQPRPPGGITAMIFASREGCVDCVKALLEKGAKVDLADPEGVTPLITAIWNTRFDTAKVLIEAGATVNKWDWWGRTPLYLAVDYNTLPHGGRPDQPSLDETTPIQIVEMLLNRGANPNLQLKMFPPYRATGNDRGLDGMLGIGTTPLIRAAKAQDVESIRLLLQHGASVSIANSLGITPLMAAAGIGSTDRDARGNYRVLDIQERAMASLDLILKAGANINEKGGRTQQAPLHGAAFWGWDKVTPWLLERGADINLPEQRGFTALDTAEDKAGSPGNTIDVSAGRKLVAEFLRSKGGLPGLPTPPAGGRGVAPPAGAARGGRGGQ